MLPLAFKTFYLLIIGQISI